MSNSETTFAKITKDVALSETEKTILREYFGLPYSKSLLPRNKAHRRRELNRVLARLSKGKTS